MHLIINFSHSLAKKGRKLIIGQYEDGMSGGLPGFGNKIITDIFHWRGEYDSLSMN